MDINDFEFGTTLARTCLQGSKRLVVCFEPGEDGMPLAGRNDEAWAQQLVADAGWDGLHILPQKLDWYQDPELWDFMQTLQENGFFTGYNSVVTYGNSMGGFGALAFAEICEANRVVALQPRTTLDNAFPWPTSLPEEFPTGTLGPHADAIDGLAEGTEILVFADSFYSYDWAHAERIKGAELFNVRFVGHAIPAFFAEIGVAGEMARRAISGKLEKIWFGGALQARGDSKIYRKGLATHFLKGGQPESPVV